MRPAQRHLGPAGRRAIGPVDAQRRAARRLLDHRMALEHHRQRLVVHVAQQQLRMQAGRVRGAVTLELQHPARGGEHQMRVADHQRRDHPVRTGAAGAVQRAAPAPVEIPRARRRRPAASSEQQHRQGGRNERAARGHRHAWEATLCRRHLSKPPLRAR